MQSSRGDSLWCSARRPPVYGNPRRLPITEDAPLSATNPYGTTKLMGEQLLHELERCDPQLANRLPALFQSGGRAPSGRIGEHRSGVPNNLMPYVSQVAVGAAEYLRGCSATTTGRPTAPACATTSM